MKNNTVETEVFEYGKVYEFYPELFKEDIGCNPEYNKDSRFPKRFMYKGSGNDCSYVDVKMPFTVKGKVIQGKYYKHPFFMYRGWCKEVK